MVFYHFLLLLLLITLFATDGDAEKNIKIPELLQNDFGFAKQIEYDYMKAANFNINVSNSGSTVIYTCKIGDFQNKDFHECFPFPPVTAVLKDKSKKTLKRNCAEFAKLHMTYWFQEHLVWCDYILPEIRMVSVISVPKLYHDQFGTDIFYNSHIVPVYEVVPYVKNIHSKTRENIFRCKIGMLSNIGGSLKIIECFPFPNLRKTVSAGNKSKLETDENCKSLAAEHFVYMYDGRMVWCDLKETKTKVVPYLKGAYLINNTIEQIYFGDKIYYDLTMPAVHKMYIYTEKKKEKTSHKTQVKKFHTCEIGAFDKQHEFKVCFPEPKRFKIPKDENDYLKAATDCYEFAKNYITYWNREGTRIVWCEEKQLSKIDSALESSTSAQQQIPNFEEVKVITVPLNWNWKFGKMLVYKERTDAKYKFELNENWRNSKTGRVQAKFVCRVGIYNSHKSEFDTCFPFPAFNRCPRFDDPRSAEKKCNRFASRFYVYSYHGRIVWCDENKDESDPIQYRRGKHVVNVGSDWKKEFGNEVYYDDFAAAVYRLHFFEYLDGSSEYQCEIGGYDTNKEFHACFPEPRRQHLPKHKDQSIVENKCKSMARLYLTFWHGGARLVWCEYEYDINNLNPYNRKKNRVSQ